MNIDIRNSIMNNFKSSSKEEIKESITDSINQKDEITLPGIGVFFELLWEQSNVEEKDSIINKLKAALN